MKPQTLGDLEDAKRNNVVGSEDRGGTLGERQHPLAGLAPCGLCEGSKALPRVDRGDGVLTKNIDVGCAAITARVHVLRSGDEADPSMSERYEVLHGKAGAGAIVGDDVRKMRVQAEGRDQDERCPTSFHFQQVRGVDRCRTEEEAVDALPPHQANVTEFSVDPAVGVAEDQAVAYPIGDLANASGDVGEEGICDIRDDQPDGA